MLKNVFEPNDVAEIISRINNLSPESHAKWGKMSVSQMLAHCNVTYKFIYEPEKHKKPSALIKFILKLFVKGKVTNDILYKPNNPTAPAFIIKDEKNFEVEKVQLISFIKQTLEKGANYFDNLESHSFGKLNKNEWNNMFYKHLDHHLRQFGA